METVTVTICKWDEFQPESFSAKYKHWFRINREIMFSETLDGLCSEVKWMWICLLSIACKKESGTFDLKFDWFSKHSGIPIKNISKHLQTLRERGGIEVPPAGGTQGELIPSQLPPTNERTNERTPNRVNEIPSEFTGEWVYDRLPQKSWDQLLKTYDDAAWIERECREMAVWLEARHEKARRTPRGWQSFVAGWLRRGWDNHIKNRVSA